VLVERLDPIVPWLAHWNKSGFDSQRQTEPYQHPHPTRMGRAAVKDHFVVHLLRLGEFPGGST
jgi:hypothetical protein